jgi:glutamate carboxypeptidase
VFDVDSRGASRAGATVREDELTAIQARVAGDLPAFLADLERLVDIDCGSYTKAGVDEVGRWVTAFLEGLGARVTRHAHAAFGDTIVGEFRGRPGGRRALLIGHMDTVFDPGTVAARPFRIAEGIAYGPGVTDMKGGLLTGLYALRAVRHLSGDRGDGRAGDGAGELPFERLWFVANPDEEIGSPTSTPIIRELAAQVDAAFVFECARANGDIVSSRKGIVDARVFIHGRAAHAGVEPEKGRSAILAAAHLVPALHDLTGRWPGVTCNVGVIHGGTRPNVVAEEARLDVDLRAIRGEDLDAAQAAVNDLLGAPAVPDVTMDMETMMSWRPMEKLERSGRLVETAVAIAGRLGFPLRDAATGGASDANTTSGMGVPSVDGLGPIGGSDHAPGEYLEVDSIVPRTTLAAGLLLAVSRDPVVRAWRAD